MTIDKLKEALSSYPDLELAVLVGSRAEGRERKGSDWDIALQWRKDMSLLETLSMTETLRRQLAAVLAVDENRIDLIDLPRAGLAMRAQVAEEGIPLHGEDSLSWNHFLSRVWRDLEDYDWDRQHAA